jgi:hypothetical protein
MNYLLNHPASLVVSLMLLPVAALATCLAWLVVPIIVRIVVPAVVESVVS